MRNTPTLYARYRYRIGGALSPVRQPDALAPVLSALETVEAVVSRPGFAHPGALDRDTVNAYALALMRLRECADAAGCARLTDACDALAVTVAALIEHSVPGHPGRWQTLKQFAVHARAMFDREMANLAAPATCPLPGHMLAEPRPSVPH
ncbi:hypothetical protein F8A86_08145 [Betaproteobacteria bacterium SCN1]|nr:hypothetical protein F8A86_08145 [Betaproteobacteria bacterium SCN1]MBN8760786.1 hypothetical protein [Thiobacillus sp.]ODU90707.1 MAG: hypothetical protein ABT21_01315 [Thiobacillus sp. SCN 65-179]OJW35867.1 MAG: hypothetical protein BGO61_07885 [Thiobacillus sp. 65-69]